MTDVGLSLPPSLERYDGALRFRVAGGRIDGLRQTPPMRAFHPHPETGEPRTVVVGNVAGGVVGGDRLAVELAVGAGESLLAATQAAEKVYRSDGAVARMRVELSAEAGGTLEWLSSGTILFDGARLDRTTTLDVAAGGRLLYCETLVFGRLARGEVFASGLLRDRVRLRLAGRLAWADDLTLGDAARASLDAPAGFGGARACTTMLLCAAGAGGVVEGLREGFAADAGLRAGVTALSPDLLLLRVLAADPAAGRRAAAAAWMALRSRCLGRPARMPTIWAV